MFALGAFVPLRADTNLPVPTDSGSNITIKLSSPVLAVPRFGFLPVRVSIENLTTRDGVWKFRFDAGSRGMFPGIATSTFELAVPSPQTREAWFFVPLAEPGVSVTAGAMTPISTLSSSTGPVPLPSWLMPPNIDGVYPSSPPGVPPPVIVGTRSTTSATGEVRTFTIEQTGPASALPQIPAPKLPPSTTMTVTPPNAAGQVTRRTVVSVVLPRSTTTVIALPAITVASTPLMSRATAESEARRILAPTSLLTNPPSVRTTVSLRSISMSSSGLAAGGGIPPSPPPMVMFEQVGPASELPLPASGVVPPGVLVTLHPGAVAGSATRIITVVEPTLIASMRAGAVAASSGSGISDRLSFARTELMRLGYLRGQPNVQQGTQTRYSSGTPGPGGPDLYILTESGPANLLPPVAPGVLPAGITSSVTQGPLPGEVSRNFIVDFTALFSSPGSPTTGGLAAARSSAVAAAVAARRAGMTGPSLPPTPLTIEVTGLGITQARLSFPVPAPNAIPPMAISPALEATLRSKLVSAYVRTVPNLAPVDPAQLPPDWRVWSSFNSVLLKADDFAALDAGRRAALRGWVALGGLLYLAPSAAGAAETENFGAGRIETMATPLADFDARELVATLPLNTLSPALPDRDGLRFSPNSAMGDLVKFEPPNILWVSILLLAFAVAIGPVNLFVLAPTSKRHRLFWTTPLLSLAGAAAVAGAIVLQDGFGGEGIRRAVVVFAPGDNQAAVFQEQAARTGFLAKRDFALDDNVLCAVVPTEDPATTGPISVGPAQFSRDRGQAAGDWFRNRSRQAQLLRNLIPTRARVELVDTAVGGA
ncbi:MAG: hypothetical protein ABIZ49_03660, partial [Opitutaceae bacterium]